MEGIPPPEGNTPVVSVDVKTPLWDQCTFVGRLNHFVRITNPLLSLKTNGELDNAALLISNARSTGYLPPGTSLKDYQSAKVLYESAFHPDTGEKMNLIGRMSFQVPGGMVILGAILVYYRTALQVLTVQWINQSFNALVNYTNRNVNSQITNKEIATAYIGATTGAVTVSIALNSLVKRAPLLVAKWVPFVAVAAANCINIPVMRQRELKEGVGLTTSNTNETNVHEIAKSKRAAAKGIGQVALSRISMTIPTLIMLPVLMTRLETKYPVLLRSNLLSVGIQTIFCGLLLCLAVPVGCALFPQRSSIQYKYLEESAQNEIKLHFKGRPLPEQLYFNKGL